MSANFLQIFSVDVILGVDYENLVEKLIRGQSPGQNLVAGC